MVGIKSRKLTAWKKNRELGDIMGGQRRVKLKDNIVQREHSLLAPSEFDEIPICFADNTSRDYYFPVTTDDIKEALSRYPDGATDFITHIWLRKHSKTKKYRYSIASPIAGSGVYLIGLYPIQTDHRHYFENGKPQGKDLHEYEKYARIGCDKKGFYAQFTPESAKQYYLEILVPFCVDWLIKEHKRRMPWLY